MKIQVHLRPFLPLFILPLLLAACGKREWRGYEKVTESFGYKFIENQDTGTLQGNGEFMIAFANIRNEHDSIVADRNYGDSLGFSLQISMRQPMHQNDLMHAFQQLSDGDSMVIKMVADTFFAKYNMNNKLPANVASGSLITLNLRVVKLMNELEYTLWLEEKEMQDKATAYAFFHSYLDAAGVTEEPVGSGVVMVTEQEGKGKHPIFGQYVLINYMMVTFEGVELANTYNMERPYTFILGSDEVVYGLNEAILRMKKGGKYRLYIPYYLAYGKEGVPGKVNPYTHLVMDVELIDFK